MVEYHFRIYIPFGTPADWRCARSGRNSAQDKTMATNLDNELNIRNNVFDFRLSQIVEQFRSGLFVVVVIVDIFI